MRENTPAGRLPVVVIGAGPIGLAAATHLIAEKLLAPTGWVRPDGTAYPSGGEWADLTANDTVPPR